MWLNDDDDYLYGEHVKVVEQCVWVYRKSMHWIPHDIYTVILFCEIEWPSWDSEAMWSPPYKDKS